jgi:hypothetical protein
VEKIARLEAEQLHRRLLEIPSFAAKLGRAHPDS